MLCCLISAITFLTGMFFPTVATAQTAAPASTAAAVLQMNVNGKSMQFDQGKIQAFIIKEDGSVSILAQTTSDILTANILVLNITPADSSKTVTKWEYRILPEDVVSDFMVRAEYAENKNFLFWWSDASKVKGGSVFIDVLVTLTLEYPATPFPLQRVQVVAVCAPFVCCILALARSAAGFTIFVMLPFSIDTVASVAG